MKMLRPLVVFVAILTICLSLAMLPEDAVETAYDETETLSYEGTPAFSSALLKSLAGTPQPTMKSAFPFSLGPLTCGCEFRLEQKAWSPHTIPDSPIILDHSFRC